MSNFDSHTAIRIADAERVVELVVDYCHRHGVSLARSAPGADVPERELVIVSGGDGGWTSINWPPFFPGHHVPVAEHLSVETGAVVSAINLWDDRGWDHVVYDAGRRVDAFLFNEETGPHGDPDAVAELLGVAADAVAACYLPWAEVEARHEQLEEAEYRSATAGDESPPVSAPELEPAGVDGLFKLWDEMGVPPNPSRYEPPRTAVILRAPGKWFDVLPEESVSGPPSEEWVERQQGAQSRADEKRRAQANRADDLATEIARFEIAGFEIDREPPSPPYDPLAPWSARDEAAKFFVSCTPSVGAMQLFSKEDRGKALGALLGELGVSFDPYRDCPAAIPAQGTSGAEVLAALVPEVNRGLMKRRDPRRLQRSVGKGPEFYHRYVLLTVEQRRTLEAANLMEFDGEPPDDDGEPSGESPLRRFFKLFSGG